MVTYSNAPVVSETEVEFKTARHSKKPSGGSNSGHIKIKINNPTKITKINYSELPIKLGFAQSSGNEDDHPLLTSIGINKTFTLPGKRGRFKIIHEDDDEYEYLDTVLETPILQQSDSKPTHQTVTHYYNGKYIVDDTKKTMPDDVNEKNNLSFRLLGINTNDQDSGTKLTPEETYRDKYAVEQTLEKPNTIKGPLSESYIEINQSNSNYTNVNVLKSRTSTKNEGVYTEDRTPNFKYNIEESKSVTKNTNEEPTFDNPVLVNISAEKIVTAPTLNKLNSKNEIETRLDHTESLSQIKHTIEDNVKPKTNNLNVIAGSFAPNNKYTFEVGPVHETSETSELTRNKNYSENVEPTLNTNNIQMMIPSQIKSTKKQKNHNVLPLKNNNSTYSSQIEKIKTVNATNTKTTTITKYEANNVSKVLTEPTVVKSTTRTFVQNEVPEKDDETKSSELEKNNKLTMPKINGEKDTNDSYVVNDPEQNHSNVLNYLGTHNKVDEKNTKVETLPLVEETITKTIVDNEALKVVDPNKLNGNNVNKNLNIFDSQKRQTIPSFDFNITLANTDDTGVADEPKQNHANLLNYLGTKIEKKSAEKEDTAVETVPSVEKTVSSVENTNKNTLVENEVPEKVDPNKFSVLENENEAVINENITKFDSQKKKIVPSFEFNFPVPEADDIDEAGEPIHNYANVLSYLGTKNKNNVAEKEDAEPIVEESTIEQGKAMDEEEVPKINDVNKVYVLENVNKVMMVPKMDSQMIMTNSKNHTINENTFDSKEIQNASSFDFNIPAKRTDNSEISAEPKQNYANVLHYVGTNSKNIHANEYTKRKTVSEVENLEVNSSSSPIIKNVVQSNIPDNLLIPKHEITRISNLYKKISSKSGNEHSDEIVHTEDHHIIAEPNIDNAPNTNVDFGSQTTFENNDNDNLEPLEDRTVISKLQPQHKNNIGHNKLEITDSSTNTVPKTKIMQLTPDETKQLIDEHDQYSKNMKPTNQINNLMPEPNNVDLNFRLGKPNNKHSLLPTEADFTTTDGPDKYPMYFEQFENVLEPNTRTSSDYYDSYGPDGYLYEGDDARSSRITYREELTQNQKEASEDDNHYMNVPYENVQPYGPSNQNYYLAGPNYPIHTYSYVSAYPYQVNDYYSQPNNANSENVLQTRDKVMDNQYLQNILNYLKSSDLMIELKRKYATAGYGADMDALRTAYIVGHLQNLGIYHKLSPEQLQFLTQQIQNHETFKQKDLKHKIEIIYDIDDNQVASNQIINPNQNYVIPAAGFYNGGATNEVRPLINDAYSHRYMLDNFDVNTVNNAVDDLGTRVLSIVTYLRNLRLPDAIIIQFIAETKKHLTNEVLQTFATECQNRAYFHLGEIIDMIAKQVLQRCQTQCPTRYVTPYNY